MRVSHLRRRPGRRYRHLWRDDDQVVQKIKDGKLVKEAKSSAVSPVAPPATEPMIRHFAGVAEIVEDVAAVLAFYRYTLGREGQTADG